MAPGFNCELCEVNWVFGRQGECDLDNRTCVCPEGFSGTDDFFAAQTCHVNQKASFVVHVVMFFLALLGVITSSCVLVLLLRRYNSKESPQNKATSDQQRLALTASDNTRHSVRKQKKRKYRKTQAKDVKRGSINVLICVAVAAFGLMLFHGFYLVEGPNQSVSLESNRPWHSIFFSISDIAASWAVCLLLGTWYSTLPIKNKIGGILGYEPFYIRYSQHIRFMIYFLMLLLPVGIIFELLILPEILDEPIYMRTSTTVFIIFNQVFFIFVLIYTEAILRNIIRTFTLAVAALEPGNARGVQISNELDKSESRQAAIKTSLETAKSFLKFIEVGVLGLVVITIVWLSAHGYYQYIFFNLSCFPSLVGFVFFPLMIYFKTNGGLVPLYPVNHSS